MAAGVFPSAAVHTVKTAAKMLTQVVRMFPVFLAEMCIRYWQRDLEPDTSPGIVASNLANVTCINSDLVMPFSDHNYTSLAPTAHGRRAAQGTNAPRDQGRPTKTPLPGNPGRGTTRRREDSNLRAVLPATPLAGERLRPLGHVSICMSNFTSLPGIRENRVLCTAAHRNTDSRPSADLHRKRA